MGSDKSTILTLCPLIFGLLYEIFYSLKPPFDAYSKIFELK